MMYDQYQGLIFDMDGTLLDTEQSHHQAWEKVLARYGISFDKRSISSLNGSPTWYIAKIIIDNYQLKLDPYQLAKEKTIALETNLFDYVVVLPLIEVVKKYHKRRPMAVGTGSEHAIAEELLRHLDLLHYFDVIVGADDVSRHKPDPQTFLRCAELLNVSPETCVVFEDATFGIIAAQEANMDVIDVRKLN